MKTTVDYYEVLGITRSASNDEVKKSYKKLAFEYHPDRNPGNLKAEERFKEINEAYQVLGHPEKRARYDSLGHITDDMLFSESGFSANFNDIFSNLFDEVFHSATSSRSAKGNDLKYSVELEFEEAVFGTEKVVTVPKHTECELCRGTGAAPGGEIECNDCEGVGQVQYSQGLFAFRRTCSSCGGMGKLILERCAKCNGERYIESYSDVSVNIPPGVSGGTRLRIRGEGDFGVRGGPPGDLYIEISVQEHPFFNREGEDLYLEVPVTFVQASLGDEIEIPTMKGKSTMKVPAGTQNGETFRLKGKGVPRLNGRGTGDLFVNVNVVVPVKLNSKQKEILKQFADATEEKNIPLVNRFLEKLQDVFGKN